MLSLKNACPEFASHCDNCVMKMAGRRAINSPFALLRFVFPHAICFADAHDLFGEALRQFLQEKNEKKLAADC
jgi:hypothetical protein